MSGNKNIFRAGIIPFIIDADEKIRFMFMKPSDPHYGGPDWQIAKGRVEGEDDNLSTALREGAEELGLKEDNIVCVYELGNYLGRTNIYVCHVKDKSDFTPFHFETGDVIWLTRSEFDTVGRDLHRHIVKDAEIFVKNLRNRGDIS